MKDGQRIFLSVSGDLDYYSARSRTKKYIDASGVVYIIQTKGSYFGTEFTIGIQSFSSPSDVYRLIPLMKV